MSTSAKIPRTLAIMAVLAIALLASSLAYPGVAEAWLNKGPIYQYPEAGGTWKYGWWDKKVRSYYIVRFSHGSTVVLNGNRQRSICTAGNRWSVAKKAAYLQGPSQTDKYYYRLC
jgi:Bacteriocin (Lactococcin_972)